MSEKALDKRGRWRSMTIAFRVSPEENEAINEAVKLSGMTKQSYIITKLQDRDVVVIRNSKTFKALRDKMDEIVSELHRIEKAGELTEDFIETINYVTTIYTNTKEDK